MTQFLRSFFVVLSITLLHIPSLTQSCNPGRISYPIYSLVDDNTCPFQPVPQVLSDEEYKNVISPVLESISSYISSQVNQASRPAISANIVYQNKLLWEGNFGLIDKNGTTKPTGNTAYRIGSISKLFPTIFLYKLWESGDLNLDDFITKYAPNFKIKNPFNFSGHLTLHDLASQVSGIPSFFPFDILSRNYFDWNGTLEETLTRLENEILLIEPRTTCYYSNMAYALLANILARNFTEDGRFDSWAEKHIVQLLELTDTGLFLTDGIKKKLATGYYPNGAEAPQLDLNWFRPAGNYYSSARDVAKISSSLMGTSNLQILRRETLVEMLKIEQKCGYGYLAEYTGSPWEINERHSYLIIQKDGDVDGYSASLALIPELQFSFTVLMSGSRPLDRSIVPTVIDKFVPVLVDILKKKDQPLSPATAPSKYVGFYQIDKFQYWNVTSTNNTLLMTNPAAAGSPYQTVGLSFVSEGILKLTLLGGEFPCVIGQSDLNVQNGALLQFRNMTEGKYNQFDFPSLNLYGFKRVI